MKLELESVPTDSKTRIGNMTIEEMRAEMDEYYEIMNLFGKNHPAENLKNLAAFTARFSHLRSHLVRKSENRVIQNFRTKELDPFIVECDRQFKIWSRLISAAQFEWEMNR